MQYFLTSLQQLILTLLSTNSTLSLKIKQTPKYFTLNFTHSNLINNLSYLVVNSLTNDFGLFNNINQRKKTSLPKFSFYPQNHSIHSKNVILSINFSKLSTIHSKSATLSIILQNYPQFIQKCYFIHDPSKLSIIHSKNPTLSKLYNSIRTRGHRL